MNDTDRIIRKIMLDDEFKPLRDEYIIDLKYQNSNTAIFEIFTSNFTPNKHYIMKAEILHIVENINNESAEILDYKILKINQRIRLNNDFNANTDFMIKYVSDDYSIKLLAINDEFQRTIYYLLYIYDNVSSVAQLVENRNLSYSTEDAVRNIISVCSAVRQCHKVNICHNDIVPENIFVSSDGSYKIGKIDMKNFVNFPDNSHQSYSLSITNELSVQNDIYMLGKFISFTADNASKKDGFLHSRLIKISEKACRKKGGYRNVDEIINDLYKSSSKFIKFLIPLLVIAMIILAGVSIFCLSHFSDKSILGDVNGDGFINQVDVVKIQDMYSSLAISDIELTKEEKAKYDINSDGYIDTLDATALMAYISYRMDNDTDMTVQEFIEFWQNE